MSSEKQKKGKTPIHRALVSIYELEELPETIHRASADLVYAHREHAEAQDTESLARFHLAMGRAFLIDREPTLFERGLSEHRLRATKPDLYEAVSEAERNMIRTQANVAVATTRWEAVKYRLQVLDLKRTLSDIEEDD